MIYCVMNLMFVHRNVLSKKLVLNHLVHVNVPFHGYSVHMYIPACLNIQLLGHIFRVVTRSRQWNYLRPERGLSYLEIICARRAGTR